MAGTGWSARDGRGALSRLDIGARPLTETPAARCVWALTRISLGWVFLWAFLDKTLGLGHETPAENAWIRGGSPTAGFLQNAPAGPFESFYKDMAGDAWADWLFMIGMGGLGLALVLGIGLRIAALAGPLQMGMMWSAVLPPQSNPFMDVHIIYALVIIGLALVAAGDTAGLGRWWGGTTLVRRFPILK